MADGLIRVNDREIKDWEIDKGDLPMNIVAVCALAFLNKSNISGATPADVEPRERSVKQLWEQIAEIPGFGEEKSKQKTVAAQPVVMKALAKSSTISCTAIGDLIMEMISLRATLKNYLPLTSAIRIRFGVTMILPPRRLIATGCRT